MRNPEKYIYSFFAILFVYIASIGVLFPKGSIVTKVMGIFFFLYILLLNLKYVKLVYFKSFALFLLYFFILVLLTSDVESSLKLYLKFSLSLLIFPLSFTLINTPKKLKGLYLSLLVVVVLYIINLALSNLLHLGGTSYSEDGIEVGNIFSEGLNSMAYLVVATPLFLYFFPNRKNIILPLMVLVMILVLIQLKRISIIAMAFGILMFLIMYKKRTQAIVGFVAVAIMFLLVFPIFEDVFYKQLEARERKLQVENLQNEGRILETQWILKENSANVFNLLFGKEMFNSAGNYGNPFSKERQIHSDYNAFLHGSGFIGLIIYLLFQGSIFYAYLKVRKRLIASKIKSNLLNLILFIFPTFFAMGFIIMISGGIYSMLFNSIRYVVLGSSLGFLYNLSHKLKKQRARRVSMVKNQEIQAL